MTTQATQAFVLGTPEYRAFKQDVADIGLAAVERALVERYGSDHVLGVQRTGPLEIMVRMRPQGDYVGGPRYFTFRVSEPI